MIFPGILVPIAIFFGFCVLLPIVMSGEAVKNIKR